MTFDKDLLSFRISHDWRNCKDPFRIESALRSRQIVSGFASEIDVDSFFPKNVAELVDSVSSLPPESSNLLTNVSMGEESTVVTAERVLRILELWKEMLLLKPDRDTSEPFPTSEAKLFAIHLHLWMTFEKFLRSLSSSLLYLEDDIELPTDFEYEVKQVLSALPRNWDFFNFIIPEEEAHRYKDSLNLPELDLCVNFQRYPGACLLVSRKGARKMLHRFLFAVEILPKDCNLFTAFDVLLSNVRQLPEHNFGVWYLDQNIVTRAFQTYTFTPQSGRAISWRNYHSSWR